MVGEGGGILFIAIMQLSQHRVGELSRGYFARLQRPPSNRRAAAQHAITNQEIRKLRTWITLFSMNPGMQEQMVTYIRDRGRSKRRQRMRQTYEGYMNGVDTTTEEILVRC